MIETLSKPIELFYAGTHTDFRRKVVTIGKSELEQSVSWFNSNGGRLPLVVGHPDSEDDHFGVATKLGINNGRVVITEVDGLDRSFRKIVNSGELPRVSAKIRLKGHPSNQSGGIEFQHAGFFGKSRVALDQLKEASFSAFNELEFYFNFMDKKKVKSTVGDDETMDETIGEDETKDEEKEPKKKGKTMEYSAFETEKLAFEKEVATFRRAQKIEPLVEAWVREGKISPIAKSGLVAVFSALPEDLDVSFSDADGDEATQSAVDFLSEFMAALPVQITYGEISADKGEKKTPTASFSMNTDKGLVNIDPDDLYSKLIATGVDVTDSAAFAKALKNLGG